VPVFLIANPDESGGGGGANGGCLVVEVPSPDPVSFLVHEILHVVLASDAATIREAAASAGISGQTLNEAIAYAFAPGLTGEAGRDLLAEGLAGYVIRGTPATDPYVQYYTMATAIRPLLRVSLDEGESLSAFLGKALEQWRPSLHVRKLSRPNLAASDPSNRHGPNISYRPRQSTVDVGVSITSVLSPSTAPPPSRQPNRSRLLDYTVVGTPVDAQEQARRADFSPLIALELQEALR